MLGKEDGRVEVSESYCRPGGGIALEQLRPAALW